MSLFVIHQAVMSLEQTFEKPVSNLQMQPFDTYSSSNFEKQQPDVMEAENTSVAPVSNFQSPPPYSLLNFDEPPREMVETEPEWYTAKAFGEPVSDFQTPAPLPFDEPKPAEPAWFTETGDFEFLKYPETKQYLIDNNLEFSDSNILSVLSKKVLASLLLYYFWNIEDFDHFKQALQFVDLEELADDSGDLDGNTLLHDMAERSYSRRYIEAMDSEFTSRGRKLDFDKPNNIGETPIWKITFDGRPDDKDDRKKRRSLLSYFMERSDLNVQVNGQFLGERYIKMSSDNPFKILFTPDNLLGKRISEQHIEKTRAVPTPTVKMQSRRGNIAWNAIEPEKLERLKAERNKRKEEESKSIS
jgi:hypothetical protein